MRLCWGMQSGLCAAVHAFNFALKRRVLLSWLARLFLLRSSSGTWPGGRRGNPKQCYISIARASEMISAVEMLLVSVESLSYPAACSWARLMPQALSPEP